MSLVVICPSRGRPDKAQEAYKSFIATKDDPNTEMVFVIDNDDETLLEYSVPFCTPDHAGGDCF